VRRAAYARHPVDVLACNAAKDAWIERTERDIVGANTGPGADGRLRALPAHLLQRTRVAPAEPRPSVRSAA